VNGAWSAQASLGVQTAVTQGLARSPSPLPVSRWVSFKFAHTGTGVTLGPVSFIHSGRRHWCHAGLHSFIVTQGRAGSSSLAPVSPPLLRSLSPAPATQSSLVHHRPTGTGPPVSRRVSLAHCRRHRFQAGSLSLIVAGTGITVSFTHRRCVIGVTQGHCLACSLSQAPVSRRVGWSCLAH
jgi:hypothetical protein